MKAFAFVKPDINWLMIKAHALVRKSQLDFVLSCDKNEQIPPLETNYDVHDYSPYTYIKKPTSSQSKIPIIIEKSSPFKYLTSFEIIQCG